MQVSLLFRASSGLSVQFWQPLTKSHQMQHTQFTRRAQTPHGSDDVIGTNDSVTSSVKHDCNTTVYRLLNSRLLRGNQGLPRLKLVLF